MRPGKREVERPPSAIPEEPLPLSQELVDLVKTGKMSGRKSSNMKDDPMATWWKCTVPNCQVMDGLIRNGEGYKLERKQAHMLEHKTRESGNTPYHRQSRDKQLYAGWSYDDDEGGGEEAHPESFSALSMTPPDDQEHDQDQQRVAGAPRPRRATDPKTGKPGTAHEHHEDTQRPPVTLASEPAKPVRPEEQNRTLGYYYEEDEMHIPSANLDNVFNSTAGAAAPGGPPKPRGKRQRSHVMQTPPSSSNIMRSPGIGQASKAGASPNTMMKESE